MVRKLSLLNDIDPFDTEVGCSSQKVNIMAVCLLESGLRGASQMQCVDSPNKYFPGNLRDSLAGFPYQRIRDWNPILGRYQFIRA